MRSKHFSQMLKSQRKQQKRLVPVFSTSMGSVWKKIISRDQNS
jgi:hypothetical protein